jgi:polysaccharide pyruvyl transferase WcaK-like protein
MAKSLWGTVDADTLLQGSMTAAIELAATRYAVDPGAQWVPGTPLKLLLAGYSGSRNTGADVRVEEMIRQFRHLCGDDHLSLSITTIDPDETRNYFRTVRQLHIPKIFPKFLFHAVHDHHGVITCEGSMFKSKFANALSTMMAGSLGLALAEGKLAIGYGGEAGHMDDSLRNFVAKHCKDAYILARNEASQDTLADLGIASDPGTDTAWTFSPAPEDVGRDLLRQAGWDGVKPVLAICPINPFWWPVKADIGRAISHRLTGAHADAHYDSVYFHKSGPDVEAAQDRYLSEIAEAVNAFNEEADTFTILVGMEMLDRKAAAALNPKLNRRAPLFISDEHDMYTMISVLYQCSLVVSSRYHALVTSMPGGVPSIGITMDERIRNLMIDRGQPELALEVDDPNLGQNLLHALRSVHSNAEETASGIQRCVLKNLHRMGVMGQYFVDHIRAAHPQFPFDVQLGMHGDPWAHLPPLPKHLLQMRDGL